MSEKTDSNQTAGADCVQHLVQPLRVIDLDSPFFWGVGRDMTDEERVNAEKHGRYDKPPMSVLGITDGLAAVEGEGMAQMFASSPRMLGLVARLAAWDKRWPKNSDSNGTSEKEMNTMCEEAHAILDELRETNSWLNVRAMARRDEAQNNQTASSASSSAPCSHSSE